MVELELEKTYLLKALPAELQAARREVIGDAYIPESAAHPTLRLRQKGDRFELTKKVPVSEGDASRQNEHTIVLSPEEAAAFEPVRAKRFRKLRYYCTIDDFPAEVDVYQDDLRGLAVIDFEFPDEEAMAAFRVPEVCLADITQEESFAGGMLAGKTYADLENDLAQYEYKPLYMEAV